MKQIELYILRRMATLTFWSLVAATLLVLTTQVLLRINVLTTTGQAFSAFLKLSAALIPSVMVIVLPFALLVGVAQILWSLNSDSELVVMEAAGAGPGTVFRPVLLLALAMSFLTVAVGNLVEPWANRKLYDIIAEASADLFSVAVRSGNFQRLDNGLYVQINEMLPGGEFGGIFLSDMRVEGKELVYFAKRGSIQRIGDDKLLLLLDGQVQQRSTGSNQISMVTFTSYALDLSAYLPTSSGGVRRPREQYTSYLLNPDPNDYYAKNLPYVMKEELVQRLTSWMYPLAFGLIAFVFLGKAHSHREEHLVNVGLMSMTAIGLRGFGFYSTDAAGRGIVMEMLAYGVPLAFIVVFGALAITGRSLRAPKAWLRLNGAILDFALERYRRFLAWRTGTKAGRA
jgi:Predicted permeases